MIALDDFKKIEVKVGTVKSAEKVPDTDKLLRLEVDFGLKPAIAGSADAPEERVDERDVRQIVSGIALYVTDPSTLVGKQLAFVTNLEPRTIKGHCE